jgi:antitoxin HicB
VSRLQQFTVSDGEMVLTLEPAEEGGYVVTSPFDPELVTEAETIEEAFEMARDAAEGLRKARVKLRPREGNDQNRALPSEMVHYKNKLLRKP